MFIPRQKPPRFDQTVEGRQLRTYLTRLGRGETNALPEFRTWLQQNQHLWAVATDLAKQAETAALALVAGTDNLTQQVLSGRLHELKVDLAGPEPTPLEQLLVDRIGHDWVLLHLLDSAALPNGQPIPLSGSFLEKAYGQIYRRYVRSIKVLAQVRRLLRRRNVRKDILQAMGAAPRDPLKGSVPRPRSQPASAQAAEPPVDRFRTMDLSQPSPSGYPPSAGVAVNGFHAPLGPA